VSWPSSNRLLLVVPLWKAGNLSLHTQSWECPLHSVPRSGTFRSFLPPPLWQPRASWRGARFVPYLEDIRYLLCSRAGALHEVAFCPLKADKCRPKVTTWRGVTWPRDSLLQGGGGERQGLKYPSVRVGMIWLVRILWFMLIGGWGRRRIQARLEAGPWPRKTEA
jgi:hypothetical protein